MKISILMLVHNAPFYTLKSILDVKTKTVLPKEIKYKLIVIDNKSNFLTKFVLNVLNFLGYIDCLHFNSENQFFAKGNNTAAKLADNDTTHYLLLNSDIKIKSSKWLKTLAMLDITRGVRSFGSVMSEPIRADGYCFLIDKFLYDKFKLDENFEWWWSITKLQSLILKEGYNVIAVTNHERFLHHYGGKSGKSFKSAKGMDIEHEKVKAWFLNSGNKVKIIDKI